MVRGLPVSHELVSLINLAHQDRPLFLCPFSLVTYPPENRSKVTTQGSSPTNIFEVLGSVGNSTYMNELSIFQQASVELKVGPFFEQQHTGQKRVPTVKGFGEASTIQGSGNDS